MKVDPPCRDDPVPATSGEASPDTRASRGGLLFGQTPELQTRGRARSTPATCPPRRMRCARSRNEEDDPICEVLSWGLRISPPRALPFSAHGDSHQVRRGLAGASRGLVDLAAVVPLAPGYLSPFCRNLGALIAPSLPPGRRTARVGRPRRAGGGILSAATSASFSMPYGNCPRPTSGEEAAAAAPRFHPPSPLRHGCRSISIEPGAPLSRQIRGRMLLPSRRMEQRDPTRSTRECPWGDRRRPRKQKPPSSQRSSRFLPQIAWCKAVRSRPSTPRDSTAAWAFRCVRAKWRRKCSRSSATSPGRSRSRGGIRILITWSRWNRSEPEPPARTPPARGPLRGGDHADVGIVHAPLMCP